MKNVIYWCNCFPKFTKIEPAVELYCIGFLQLAVSKVEFSQTAKIFSNSQWVYLENIYDNRKLIGMKIMEDEWRRRRIKRRISTIKEFTVVFAIIC